MVFMLNSPAVTLMIIFVTVLSVLLIPASYGSGGGRRVHKVGAKMDMGDVRRNKEVQELGRFSVEEYNKRIRVVLQNDAVLSDGAGNNGAAAGGEKVEFMKVMEAQKQVVVGTKYYLKIWAEQNGRYREFDSVVEEKPWLSQNSKQLISFAPSHQRKRDQKDGAERWW
ncbi:cysteine proteinase inhibitor 4-like [Prosopis cineraria]|uniref:cysteine proteinase inhibitor 4-like n=1 Tax=Prosopis cineraria TaxID=364024 RepID=UPI0024107E0A|nr:cysteine proteinase inhibitor 4-like [Prosopis cineraria]